MDKSYRLPTNQNRTNLMFFTLFVASLWSGLDHAIQIVGMSEFKNELKRL